MIRYIEDLSINYLCNMNIRKDDCKFSGLMDLLHYFYEKWTLSTVAEIFRDQNQFFVNNFAGISN